MAKDFVKLSEVAVREEVSENATVLVEENGEIYRAPKTQVGGAGGVKTAIVRDSYYLNRINEVMSPKVSGPLLTYECINMTFEEAYETMKNGEPLAVMGMFTDEAPICFYGNVIYGGMLIGVPCIQLSFVGTGFDYNLNLFWTADGLSEAYPGGPV